MTKENKLKTLNKLRCVRCEEYNCCDIGDYPRHLGI